MVDHPTPTRAEVLGFLRGHNALAGRWFGDRIPGMPAYWWRSYLRVLDDPVQSHTIVHVPLMTDIPAGAHCLAADRAETEVRLREPPPVVAQLEHALRDEGDMLEVLDYRPPPEALFYEAPSFEELERRRLARGESGLIMETNLNAPHVLVGGLVERQAVLDALADYPQAQQAVRSIPYAAG